MPGLAGVGPQDADRLPLVAHRHTQDRDDPLRRQDVGKLHALVAPEVQDLLVPVLHRRQVDGGAREPKRGAGQVCLGQAMDCDEAQFVTFLVHEADAGPLHSDDLRHQPHRPGQHAVEVARFGEHHARVVDGHQLGMALPRIPLVRRHLSQRAGDLLQESHRLRPQPPTCPPASARHAQCAQGLPGEAVADMDDRRQVFQARLSPAADGHQGAMAGVNQFQVHAQHSGGALEQLARGIEVKQRA